MNVASVEPRHEKGHPSRLADLLACEQELAELMSGATEEARKCVEAARRDAEQAAAELDASLEAEEKRARGEIAEVARARADALLVDARARAGRFDGVSDEQIARLASSALRRLLGLEGAA